MPRAWPEWAESRSCSLCGAARLASALHGVPILQLRICYFLMVFQEAAFYRAKVCCLTGTFSLEVCML